jgi:hypothetical protein
MLARMLVTAFQQLKFSVAKEASAFGYFRFGARRGHGL